MGRQAGEEGRVGKGRGTCAMGMVADGLSLYWILATSWEFLRLWSRVGMVKVGVKLLFHFSNVSLSKLEEVSVRGELWRASQKKEEEEGGKSGGRLLRREPVLSRLGSRKNPAMSQIRRGPNMCAPYHVPRKLHMPI